MYRARVIFYIFLFIDILIFHLLAVKENVMIYAGALHFVSRSHKKQYNNCKEGHIAKNPSKNPYALCSAKIGTQ